MEDTQCECLELPEERRARQLQVVHISIPLFRTCLSQLSQERPLNQARSSTPQTISVVVLIMAVSAILLALASRVLIYWHLNGLIEGIAFTEV
jgi:hypothetical protein